MRKDKEPIDKAKSSNELLKQIMRRKRYQRIDGKTMPPKLALKTDVEKKKRPEDQQQSKTAKQALEMEDEKNYFNLTQQINRNMP